MMRYIYLLAVCVVCAAISLGAWWCDQPSAMDQQARRKKLSSRVERKIQKEITAYETAVRDGDVVIKVRGQYLCASVLNAPGDQLARYSRDFVQDRDVLAAAKQTGITIIMIHNNGRYNEINTTTGTMQMLDELPGACR